MQGVRKIEALNFWASPWKVSKILMKAGLEE